MAKTPMGNPLPGRLTELIDGAARPDGFERDERLYSAREVAERLGVSERWVRDHATRRNPRISAVKLGPLLRFRWRDVEEFVAAQTTDPARRFRGNVGQDL